MSGSNITTVKDFFIMGFPGLEPRYYGLVSALFFITYLIIVVGNLFILGFVSFERSLHKPTYIIFCHLAMNDLLFGTVTLPKMIAKYWLNDSISSFAACFTQMYFVHSLGAIQSLNLMIMALDRFIAICVPLRYPYLITNFKISIACTMSWMGHFLRMLAIVFHALTLPYCNSSIIVQCYCDHNSITSLGCGKDRIVVQAVATGFAMISLLLPLAFIVFSYISVIVVVMKMPNLDGRYKALSTCTPQIVITCLYYLPRCFLYIANVIGLSFSLDLRIVIVLVYSLLPSAINPIIYCFKTKHIKELLTKRIKKTKIGINLRNVHK